MIINQGDIGCIIVIPAKDDPPLVIDSNAEKGIQIAFERLQPVARQHLQIRQAVRSVQNSQLVGSCLYLPLH